VIRPPPVPAWFKRAIKRINPRWVLVFRPPSQRGARGVNPEVYPKGVWDICTKLPRSQALHPHVTLSLADIRGHYVKPGPDTLKLLRIAEGYHRRKQTSKLERVADEAWLRMRKERARNSEEGMRRSMARFCSLYFGRQWNNRVTISVKAKGRINGELPVEIL